MTRRNAVRSLASLLLLGAASSAVMAQNFEYTTSQGNLSQVRVTSALHANLQAYVANFPAAQDLRIAILDGLADVSHSDLAGRIEAHLAYDGSYGRADGHGTHVAGIAGASRNGSGIVGVAPTAKLLSIPVFDDYGWVAWDGGRAAFDRAQSLGAKVVNMSYGSTLRGQTFLPGELDVIDDYRNSMVMVRAAGNQGATLSRIAYSGDASNDLAHLLIVGSVNSRGTISSFSNRPGESCIANSTRCAADDKIKNFFIVAPGERVLSDLPLNAWGMMSGTSMAAPTVAGAAALVFQDAYNGNTFLTPAQVAGILKRSAKDLGIRGVDSIYGWGLLNVAAALGPVGPTRVATGGSVAASTARMDRSLLMPGAGMARQSAFGGMLSGMVVFDDYGRGFVMKDAAFETARSTLAEDASAAALASVTASREVAMEQDGVSLALTGFGDAGGDGFSGLSFTSDDLTVSAGLGNTQAFFTQTGGAGGGGAGQRIGTQFFAGAGEIGQGFAQGGYLAAEARAGGLTYSALFLHGAEALSGAAFDPLLDQDAEAPESQLMMLGAEMPLAGKARLGIGYGVLRESGAVLGMRSDGAFALGDDASTQIVGASLSAALMPGLELQGFAQLGLTEAAEAEDSVFSALSDVWSAKMGLSLAASDTLRNGDSLTLSLVSPWRIVEGDATARVAVGREFDGTVNYETRNASLAPGGLPLDLGLAYTGGTGDLRYSASLWLRDHDTSGGATVNEAAGALGLSWRF